MTAIECDIQAYGLPHARLSSDRECRLDAPLVEAPEEAEAKIGSGKFDRRGVEEPGGP